MPVLSDRDVIDQIISGHYADPFALLGMHATDNGLQVRALLPDATEVWLIEQQTGRRLAQLNCDDPRGFFSAVVPRRKNPFRYQLQVSWRDHQQTVDDPYRFGPLLQDIDSWLLAEGTHLRPYERTGAHLATLDGVDGVSFAVWAPNAQRVSVVGSSTSGTAAAIRCVCGVKTASGSCSCPAYGPASCTNMKSSIATAIPS